MMKKKVILLFTENRAVTKISLKYNNLSDMVFTYTEFDWGKAL